MEKIPTPEQALESYRPLVEQFDQAAPMLLAGLTDSTTLVGLNELGDHPIDALSVLASKIDAGQIERPQWIVFSVEALMKIFPQGMPKDTPRGTLQRDAQAGDKSVEDVVVCHCVSRKNGLEWSVTQSFRRLEAFGTVAWQDPVRQDVDTIAHHGMTFKLMRQIVGAKLPV